MIPIRLAAGAALASCLSLAAAAAHASPADYRFELVGAPKLLDRKDVVQVRLVRVPDGQPVPDAVIFEAKADMGPAGMEAMTAPVKAVPVKAAPVKAVPAKAIPAGGGVYGFEIEPSMAGTWALHLAAKVQGEAETVRGTVQADLAK